jgi:hypothetical protein
MDQSLFDSLQETIRALRGKIMSLENLVQRQESKHVRQMDNLHMQLKEKNRLIQKMNQLVEQKDGEILALDLETRILQQKLASHQSLTRELELMGRRPRNSNDDGVY